MDPKSSSSKKKVAGAIVLLVIAGVAFFLIRMDRKAERIIAPVEKTASLVQAGAERVGDVGGTAVDKAKEAVQSMDAKDLGNGLTEGTKEVGNVVKEETKKTVKSWGERLRRKKGEPAQHEGDPNKDSGEQKEPEESAESTKDPK